ncbi:MAG: hypothetical protein V2I74_10980, partial [Erythrobacter sp.]|nr:hypothetical protein [Erythrobacter sp.]
FPLSMGEADQLRSAPPGSGPRLARHLASNPSIQARLDRAYGLHWHDGSWWRPNPGEGMVKPLRSPIEALRRWVAAVTGIGNR